MTGQILLPLLVFLLMNLTQIQCDTTASIMPSTWTSEATSSMTSNQPSGTSASSLISSYASSPTTPFPSTYITSPPAQSSPISTMNPSTLVTSPITQSSPMSSMNPSSSITSPMSSMNPSSSMTSPMSSMNPSSSMTSPMSSMNPSTYVTSSNVATSVTTVTNQQNYTTYDLTYQFTVSSSSTLKIGNFTDPTLLKSVQTMVISAFNLTNFNITVIRVEIRSQAKALPSPYQMLTESLFRTIGTSCPYSCIQNSIIKSVPTQTFLLFTNNNNLVSASALSAPTYVSTGTSVTTTTVGTYSTGDAPPGIAGKLGMGLGISFIAVLLIAEVIILYRKFGCQPLNRQSQYEMSAYQDNFS